jgi:UPF0755 protein
MPEPMSYDDPFEGIFDDRSSARPNRSVSSTAPGPVRTSPAVVPPAVAPQPAAVAAQANQAAAASAAAHQAAPGSTTPASSAANPPVPGSRRAAREAAARAATGEVAPTAAPPSASSLEPTPAASATPAVPATAFPLRMPGAEPVEASGFQPLPLRPVRTISWDDDGDIAGPAAGDPFATPRDAEAPGPMRTPNGTGPTGRRADVTGSLDVDPAPTAALAHVDGGRSGAVTQPLLAESEPLLPGRRTSASADAVAAAFPDSVAPAQTDITLDDLFAHAPTPGSGGGGKGKGKTKKDGSHGGGRLGGFVILGIIVVLIGGLVAGGMWAWNQYGGKVREVMGWTEPIDYASGQAHGDATITINDGDSGMTVSKTLAEAGVTKTPQAFYQMLVKSGKNPTFYPGVYKLKKEMTSAAALAALEDPSSKLQNTALLREGLTEDQILKTLSDTLKIPIDQFQAAVAKPADYGVTASSLEGWLFPAQYTFEPGVTAPQVIKKMVDRTVQSLDKAGVPLADRQRILIIASIIQREARNSQDFYKVSRVIENRLQPNNADTFGKLQMDSTAQYGYGQLHNGTASSSAEALKDPNPYNTYVHPGLPVGPISSPGDLAIDAAMHPAAGTWMYFTTVNMNTGETVFSTTYSDQEKAVQQMRTWCKANPNSGC